ncbi:MAG: ABC transporter substrate-binding protein [Elainella sp. Prado103]|jgi:branched-chain amino acid transport system substrate-binding protein|nr:ABC transporter substrate-binding protein [Elainella sp. Prado103]
MAQKNETPVLLVALLATILLLGGGLWWFSQRLSSLRLNSDSSGGPASASNSNPLNQTELQSRFSQGDRLLVPTDPAASSAHQDRKQAGAAAIAAQNYPEAVAAFESALQAKPNDPESLIYLNNARIADQSAYEIAITVPLDTDLDASLEMLRGVAEAQNEINVSGGIRNTGLKVRIVNDGGTPDRARQVATALLQEPSILGVVGHYSSDMSLAAGEVYDQGKLVMISPVSTSVKLSNFSPFVFRTVPSDFVAARALADHMVSQLQQQKAAVFFNSQSNYSQSLKSEFTSAVALGGGQVVSEFDLSSPSFSAAASFKQATQQGATTLVLLPNSSQLDRALQVVQVNQQQLTLLGGDDVYAPKTLSVAGAAAQNMVVAVPWHILSNPNSPFVRSSRSLWKADVNWRTAMSYDAANALITAITADPNPTRETIQAALAGSNFAAPGASGEVRFLPSGDRNQTVQLVTVEPGRRSGYGFDFVPLP